MASNSKPILRLIPPQRVADSEQVAPLQYSIEDTARLMGYSRRTIERWIARGRLSVRGRGKLRRVPYESIVKLLAELERDGEAA